VPGCSITKQVRIKKVWPTIRGFLLPKWNLTERHYFSLNKERPTDILQAGTTLARGKESTVKVTKKSWTDVALVPVVKTEYIRDAMV